MKRLTRLLVGALVLMAAASAVVAANGTVWRSNVTGNVCSSMSTKGEKCSSLDWAFDTEGTGPIIPTGACLFWKMEFNYTGAGTAFVQNCNDPVGTFCWDAHPTTLTTGQSWGPDTEAVIYPRARIVGVATGVATIQCK